jgi:DNA-binding NtrC family response regulator
MEALVKNEPRTGPEAASEAVRVLVVEDDPDMLYAIRDGLTLLGFSVTTAADGLEGARLAVEKDFEVVVSDIRLPGLSGTDLSHRISGGPRPPKVILITAYPCVETVEEASISGAVQFLSKPLSLRVLAQTVHLAAMERKAGHAMLQRPPGWPKK